MMILAELSLESADDTEHLSGPIAAIVEVLRSRDLEVEVGPSGTAFLGEAEEVFEAVHDCHRRLANDHQEVRTVVQFDQRSSFPKGGLEAQIRKVEQRLDGDVAGDRDQAAAQALGSVQA